LNKQLKILGGNMDEVYKILAINPGSTSTKVAVYENLKEIFSKNITHDASILKKFKEIQDQLPYRKEMISKELENQNISLKDINIFVGRGGGLVPIKGGTYAVNAKLLDHAGHGMSGQHPAQLASQICNAFAKEYSGKAYVVNPPDVDEFDEIARVTGLSDVYRQSRIHTLNQKEVALRYCNSKKAQYNESSLVICHIGGGISVTSHKNGRMIDSNDIINGDGPMTPTRAGSLPTVEVLKLCFSGKYTEKQLYNRLSKDGGLIDHLGTAEVVDILKKINDGDNYAELILNAMIYQIAKSVGSCACVLKGKVDAIILTGGISKSDYLVSKLKEYVDWIAPVEVMAGEFEMEALVSGIYRVLTNKEKALEYTGEPVWKGFKK
jgi:butyrate kinase